MPPQGSQEEITGPLEFFVRHCPVAVAVLDTDLRFLGCSERWRADHGLEGEDLHGRGLHEVSPTAPERWRDIRRRCLDGEILQGEEDLFELEDGSVGRLRWEARPWWTPEEEIGGLLIFTERRTEQEQEADRLRRMVERFQVAKRLARLGSFERNFTTGEAYWSPLLYEVFDRDPADGPLSLHEMAQRLLPEDGEALLGRVEAALATGREFSADLRVPQADGRVVHLEAHATVERGAGDGSGTRVVGAVQDVTDEKGLEERMRRLDRLEAVGRLAGGVAHDFNNLLGVVLGCAESALELVPHDGDPLREDLQEILRSAERGAELTRRLLAFGRQQVLALEPVDLGARLETLRPMLRRLVPASIDLELRVGEDLPRVKVDPSQFDQVVTNLVTNARDAIDRHGLVEITTGVAELDDGYTTDHPGAAPGTCVVLEVSDTGAGIPPEVREHIFEPFFTTKEDGKGTGLGLASTYGIVKQLGGNIWVYSEPGKGTTFRIYFPALTEADEASPRAGSAAAAPEEDDPGGHETVLVVEDEEGLRHIAVRSLERKGFRVLPAEDPGTALLLVEKHDEPIDLLLTDFVMPRMNGDELAAKLTALRPGMKVLFMSGYSETLVHRGRSGGGEIQFLQKPFRPRELVAKVRAVLDGGDEDPEATR